MPAQACRVEGRGSQGTDCKQLTNREIWALVHGLVIGGPFLLGFTGALVALAGLRSDYMTAEGVRHQVTRLRIGACVMAVMAWAIVFIGTWVLLPWYHEDVSDSPQSILLSNPEHEQSHEFADVWKTHVAFMAPILATAAARSSYYGRSLARDRTARNVVLMLLLGAFAVSSLAALIGSLVTRAAPIH